MYVYMCIYVYMREACIRTWEPSCLARINKPAPERREVGLKKEQFSHQCSSAMHTQPSSFLENKSHYSKTILFSAHQYVLLCGSYTADK